MSGLRSRADQWLHGKLIYNGVVRAIGEGGLFARLRELRQLERLPPDQLARYQAERLARALAYAATHSPYYRKRWQPNGALHAENAWDELQRVPLLPKAELQRALGELRAEVDVGRVAAKITGGSTGQAVTILKDRTATTCERAAMWLGYGWFNVQIGDPSARFWGAPFAHRRRLVTRASDFAMNRIRFSAFAFSDSDLERYWRRCLAFRPAYFNGYVSMLEAFADFVRQRGYDGSRLQLKSIVATSEVLSAPQRALIEDTFGTRVQVEYGCGEVGPIAYECEQGRLHLMTADVAIELLTPDGRAAKPGETAEVVITDLNNRAAPLLRYRIGDFAVAGEGCDCGRGFPVIEKIWGREYDFIQGADGRRYHGEFFMYLFEDLRREGAGVRQFQVTQSGPLDLQVAVVPHEDWTASHDARLQQLVLKRLGAMTLTVAPVAAIERAASGKMQVIRNHWLKQPPTPTSPSTST